MATARTHVRYPWGTLAPRERLRVVCAKASQALDDAKVPGFGQVSDRVSAAVQASRPLVDALRFLSDAGLRSKAGGDFLPADEVRDAVGRVDRAVSDLAAASVLELSEGYRGFSEAVNALLEVAEACKRRGIASPAAARAHDAWAAFER